MNFPEFGKYFEAMEDLALGLIVLISVVGLLLLLFSGLVFALVFWLGK